MSDTKCQNARARAAGGFAVMPELPKNTVANAMYRRAIMALTDKMLVALYKDLERTYTTIAITNAAPKLRGRSIRNVEKLLKYFKTTYGTKFQLSAEKIIKQWLRKATKNAQKFIVDALRKIHNAPDFNATFDSGKYDSIIALIVSRNVGLVQNTTVQTLNNIENIVYDGITTGKPWSAVKQDLSSQRHIARDRIKRIANDQTLKLNATVSIFAQRDAGITHFRWRTMGDLKVSGAKQKAMGKTIPVGSHVLLDGKIYAYNEPNNYPVVDSYGHRGLPGIGRVNCRCQAQGIVLSSGWTLRRKPAGDWIISKDDML